jgi:hypothetical protein
MEHENTGGTDGHGFFDITAKTQMRKELTPKAKNPKNQNKTPT